jgi:hypothetical protein
MSRRNRTRLNKLCSRALVETDPQKLVLLLTKIHAILSETVAELSAMLNDLEPVLSRPKQLSRAQLVKPTETPRFHNVGFYSDDRQFLEHLTQFLGGALKGGDAAILVATEPHRASLLPRLQAFGVDIGMAIEQGRYVALDVGYALTTFMRDGMPDRARYIKVIDQLILTAANATRVKHPRVAIFGECVHLLCEQGNAEAAIEIEKLCNQLVKTHDVDILCGYFPLRLAGRMDDHVFGRICDEHSAVHYL